MGLHSAIVMPYLTHYGTKEQQERYIPRSITSNHIYIFLLLDIIMLALG